MGDTEPFGVVQPVRRLAIGHDLLAFLCRGRVSHLLVTDFAPYLSLCPPLCIDGVRWIFDVTAKGFKYGLLPAARNVVAQHQALGAFVLVTLQQKPAVNLPAIGFLRVGTHLCAIICLEKLAGKYYSPRMKITEKLRKQIRKELASAGGKARAKKYSKKTLSKWAKKGGRPRKDGAR